MINQSIKSIESKSNEMNEIMNEIKIKIDAILMMMRANESIFDSYRIAFIASFIDINDINELNAFVYEYAINASDSMQIIMNAMRAHFMKSIEIEFDDSIMNFL
jgi:hypothetical protein